VIVRARRRSSPPTPPPPGGDGRRVGRADIARAVESLGLAGRPLCVHASLRSFGRVSGGADAVVDGLLDAGATVLVPTSTFRWCMAPRPDGPPLPGNAEDDGSIPAPGTVPVAGFSPLAEFLDPAMGAIPAAVLRRPARRRGRHPLSSFAALGPGAAELVRDQAPDDVFAPLNALTARRGAVLAMGVGLDAVTLLHLAELRAGLPLLTRWALQADGRSVAAPHGGCSRGFERLAGAVVGAERLTQVGASAWRVFDAVALLEAATARFEADPSVATCAHTDCARCRERRALVTP
jgi:aminoglycoside 3-N-acetyltransferase